MKKNLTSTLEKVYETLIHVALFQHPYEKIRPHIDDAFMGYGTALDEKLRGWEGFHWMVARQRKEISANNVAIKRYPVQKSVFADEHAALIVEEMEFTMVTEEGPHGFTMRLTTVMEYADDRWRVLHFHGSTADADTPEGNAWPIEEWKRRNAELQRVVEEKTSDLLVKNRELEIEAALERVRARTMAMVQSDELPEVAHVMFTEIRSLGIPAWSAGYNILSADKKTSTCIMSSEGQVQSAFQLPLLGEKSFEAWYQATIGDDSFFVQELGGSDLEVHYQYLMSLPGIQEAIDPLQQAGISFPTYQVNHLSFFTQGFLLFITYEKIPEAHAVFKRFTRIFEQAYTRFLDLEKAEAQAREARIETALERVRSRTMGMRESDELKEVIQLVFDQFIQLDIFVEHTGFIMDYQNREDMLIWLADPKGVPTLVSIPYFSSPHWNSFIEARKEGSNFFSNLLTFDEKNKFYRELFPHIPGIPEKAKAQYLDCPGLAISTVLMDNVGLYIENFSGLPYSDEENETLMRFGKVFQQTYTRFLDLKQAEHQEMLIRQEKERLEKTLAKLRATQSQLIHAEKMASLGELTAGIAHEIKNPLNFVHNFSEVNEELLTELEEEITEGNTVESMEVIGDLKSNMQKIIEHGRRADSIVKGMLMHSRNDRGERELTDVNALCDEYLRLAYHGLRAKDKSFHAELVTVFDPDIPKVMLAPQEIGRVLLNLISNAFYAVDEQRSRADQANYTPAVSIKTTRANGTIFITVSDNGTGMPPELTEKIFQPFFTTKPTGSGTGLGLSLSYDVVKSHGGEMTVESQPGEGSAFTISLPIDREG